MILDVPRVSDLAQGGRIIVQPEDGQLVIPPVLMLSIPPAAPLSVLTDSTFENESSFATEYQVSLTGLAGADDRLCTLAKGLWSLSVHIATATSAVVALKFAELMLDYQGYRVRLGALSCFGANTTLDLNRTLNLRSTAILYLRYPATAADFIYIRAGILATRLL